MKLILFILLPFAAFAQRYTLLDTVYTVSEPPFFYTVHDVTYSTGEQSTDKTLIGDTAAYFSANFTRFQDVAKKMSVEAQQVFNMGKQLNDMKKENDKILTATGRDIMDTITVRMQTEFTAAGWTIKDTSVLDIEFTINANGQLRYQVQGFATRNVNLYGDALTLNNYLSSGKDLHLFKTESGNYKNREGGILLRRPGGATTREALAEKVKESVSKGIFLEYYTDATGKVTFYAGDNVVIKKTGTKYTVKTANGKTFEITEKK